MQELLNESNWSITIVSALNGCATLRGGEVRHDKAGRKQMLNLSVERWETILTWLFLVGLSLLETFCSV